MLKIGLTGGIGSGKSTVAKFFSVLGVPVFNSDEEAKKIVSTDTSVKSQIIQLLGKDSFSVDGIYNRNYVAQIVFNDAAALQQLNNIIHPAVKNRFNSFCNQHFKQKYIIKESAILIETNLFKELDQIILVVAPEDIKFNRLLKREQTDVQSLKKKMSTQWSDQIKKKYAHFVINNDDREMLIPQVLSIHNIISH